MGELDDALGAVTGSMPVVQSHAIEGAAAETGAESPQAAPAAAGPTDRQGRGFDPALHETGANGSPVTNKDGTLRLKRGRGAAKAKLNEDYGPIGSAVKTPEMARMEPTATKTGHLIAEQIFGIGRMIGGEEWAPVLNPEYGLDERAQMRDAWAAYCEAKDIQDIPPGIALSMVMFAYASPRLFMPKTKSRLQKAKEWAITKAVQLKLWKGRPADDTRPDSGNDGKRENDDSKKAGR